MSEDRYMQDRIEAAADWLMQDDSAYASEPEMAKHAAKKMLEASDKIEHRVRVAADRAIVILNGPHLPMTPTKPEELAKTLREVWFDLLPEELEKYIEKRPEDWLREANFVLSLMEKEYQRGMEEMKEVAAETAEKSYRHAAKQFEIAAAIRMLPIPQPAERE